jgi:hypothetical protein
VAGVDGDSAASMARQLTREEGLGWLWKGARARCLTIAPTAVVMSLYYETLMKFCAVKGLNTAL